MRNILFLALSAMVLSACAGARTGDSGARLANTTWRFTAIDGAAPVSAKAHLSFERGRLGANAGCNGMGGQWRIEGARLIAGPLVQTEMYCEGPVWGQEQAIAALLAAAPEIRIQGDRMSLRSGGHSAELRRVG